MASGAHWSARKVSTAPTAVWPASGSPASEISTASDTVGVPKSSTTSSTTACTPFTLPIFLAKSGSSDVATATPMPAIAPVSAPPDAAT